jgi:hypothetical protein
MNEVEKPTTPHRTEKKVQPGRQPPGRIEPLGGKISMGGGGFFFLYNVLLFYN